jgi:hypothetical protein
LPTASPAAILPFMVVFANAVHTIYEVVVKGGTLALIGACGGALIGYFAAGSQGGDRGEWLQGGGVFGALAGMALGIYLSAST